MMWQRDYVGLDEGYVSRVCTFDRAQQRQRNKLCCWGFPSLSRFSCRQSLEYRAQLFGLCKEIKSLHSLGSNLRAWTKTADNFYGDDDDTLFEPAHDSSVISSAKISTTERNSPSENLGWPLWLFGPFILLGTGVVPTLWLPSVPLFAGSATAGLLALAGLDGIFNLGASIFLLMTDSCARNQRHFHKNGPRLGHEIPSSYKFWTLFVNMVGLLGPLIAYVGSKSGCFGAEPLLLSIAAMIVPYVSLLLVHTLVELLVWKWQSPVWLIVPLVYGCYSVLQLSRGLQLGQALGAPLWTIEAVKGLISWWVYVLSVQLMWIAWFVGDMIG
ncbi:hypothetical protein GOP47_0027830 [Adiantum capillus-veneris]|nr:hypothetical protein GOP47_0027830 [Adiantum capillus-veneris]